MGTLQTYYPNANDAEQKRQGDADRIGGLALTGIDAETLVLRIQVVVMGAPTLPASPRGESSLGGSPHRHEV